MKWWQTSVITSWRLFLENPNSLLHHNQPSTTMNYNDDTTISNLLQEFVQDKRATQEEVNKLAEGLKKQWLKKIGDFKRFTMEELQRMGLPAMLTKHLEDLNLVNSPGNSYNFKNPLFCLIY